MCAEIAMNFNVDLSKADLSKMTLADLLKPHVGDLAEEDIVRISVDREAQGKDGRDS